MSVSAGLLAGGGGGGVSQNTRTLNLTVDPDISWPGAAAAVVAAGKRE